MMQLERYDMQNNRQTLRFALNDIRAILEVKTKVPLKRSPKELEKFIEKHTKKLEKMYADFWVRQKALISRKAVISSMGSYTMDMELQTKLNEGLIAFVENEFNPVYQDLINEAGTETARKIVRAVNKPMGFDIMSDRIVNLVKTNALKKITQISMAQTESVRLALMGGLDRGWGVMKIQASMKDSVPLTERLTKAWLRHYDRLGDDPALTTKIVEYKSKLYRKKLLKYRRRLITRTELQRSHNTGNLESVQQAIDGGVIKKAKKTRRVVMDGREQHGDFEGEESNVGEPYPLSGETYAGELSFNCRCTDEITMEV